jgi:hypothetical protein
VHDDGASGKVSHLEVPSERVEFECVPTISRAKEIHLEWIGLLGDSLLNDAQGRLQLALNQMFNRRESGKIPRVLGYTRFVEQGKTREGGIINMSTNISSM